MDFPSAISAWFAGAIAAALVAGLFVYGFLLRNFMVRGGKVSVAEFGSPDIGFVLMLVTWFSSLMVKGFAGDPHPVKIANLVQGAFLFFVIVSAIATFLRFRGIKLAQQFGLARLPILQLLAIAAGLFLAAFPLAICAGVVMQNLLGPDAKPQETVQFFLQATKNSDLAAMVATVLIGVVLAPIAEEFIFRGYIYGVLKRYLGMTAGIVLNAALFAAIHLNLTSLPALFMLAVCLTIAYETTGSILVSMSMHAMFNLVMFAGLIHAAHALQ